MQDSTRLGVQTASGSYETTWGGFKAAHGPRRRASQQVQDIGCNALASVEELDEEEVGVFVCVETAAGPIRVRESA